MLVIEIVFEYISSVNFLSINTSHVKKQTHCFDVFYRLKVHF